MLLRARWLCFVIGSLALAQESPLAIVEGTVLHAVTKEPVRKARVKLELSHGEHESALVATTDSAGLFRFADIPEGSYNLTVEKTGFLDGSYGQTKLDSRGSLLKVASGDRLQGLQLLLFPGGTISGRVLDADGDPLPGNGVTLWARNSVLDLEKISHVSETEADRSGEYSFRGLTPGTYYVSANADVSGYVDRQVAVDHSGKPSKMHDLQTFYPAALSLEQAQAIRIDSGREQSAIDIRVLRGSTFTVKGKIAGVTSVPSTYHLSATIEDGMSSTSEGGELLSNGEFIIRDLPPGKHRLLLISRGPDGFVTSGQTDINLSSEDLSGVVISPFKPAMLRVRVVIEGEEDKPFTSGFVFLNALGDSGSVRHGNSEPEQQNGQYVLKSIDPGKYWIGLGAVNGCYLKSLQSGGQALDPEALEIADGEVEDVQMTYSRNVASLTGDVEIPDDQAEHSVHVVLISEQHKIAVLKYRWPELDQTLHFLERQLQPGKYLVFATEEDDAEPWRQARFVSLLQDKGVELDLHEKEHATTHLKLINKDETDRLRKQLGL